jgi:alkylation response protein AidB-like acyl-CoA dehydrogenase
MDLHLSPEQEQLVATFEGLLTKYSSTDSVRDTESTGHDPDLWDRMKSLGVLEMAVDETQGGWGALFLDIVLIAEARGRHIAPVPLIEAVVAARLLARCDDKVALRLLADVLAGRRLVVFSPQPARGGQARLVPGGSIADNVLVFTGDEMCAVPLLEQREPIENIGSLALADVRLDGAEVALGTQKSPRIAYETALNEWLVLTSASLVGLGAKALQVGVAYVQERKAWGSPIGSFQAIAHPLADSATAVDGARLLTYEAAWLRDVDDANLARRADEVAKMCFAFSTETACDVTQRSLHFHGGYGFMLDYDIQMYYRRARAWPAVFCEPERAYQMAGDDRYGPGGGGSGERRGLG